MDKKITAILGLGIFLLFVGGLAKSIGQMPFAVIVSALAIYGVYEELRSDKDVEDS